MEKNSIKGGCELLVVGGSAGSLDVILKVLPSIRSNFNIAIVIVLHRKNNFESVLTSLFAAKTSLPVKEAEEKDVIEPGCIYIAPADYHLLVEKNSTFSLDFSEKVNFSRPSIDVTFESAADACGSRLSAFYYQDQAQMEPRG